MTPGMEGTFGASDLGIGFATAGVRMGHNPADPSEYDSFPLVQSSCRYSLAAQATIVIVALFWALIVDERFFSGDAVIYFNMLLDGSWADSYLQEPTMFLVLALLSPKTFPLYVFLSGALPLTIILYAFYRLRYSRIEQFLLILFFSCSFYGVHFLLDFQRQFYALAFFVLAVSLRKSAAFAWIASLFSHAFAFTLLLFWAARKLPARVVLVACTVGAPLLYFLTTTFVDERKLFNYASNDSNNLVIRQLMNLFYIGIILLTVKKGENQVRSMSWLYIALAAPTLMWPEYRGIFDRFDYYFFPAVVALWPTCLRPGNRSLFLFRGVLFASTVLGFILWMKMNFGWIISPTE